MGDFIILDIKRQGSLAMYVPVLETGEDYFFTKNEFFIEIQ